MQVSKLGSAALDTGLGGQHSTMIVMQALTDLNGIKQKQYSG